MPEDISEEVFVKQIPVESCLYSNINTMKLYEGIKKGMSHFLEEPPEFFQKNFSKVCLKDFNFCFGLFQKSLRVVMSPYILCYIFLCLTRIC